jgi:hypothetical protein
MRTISATVNSREEADAARRRLQALGIEDDRILFTEVDEPAAGSIFVTVKAAPEQVAAATDILNGARQPNRSEPARQAPHPSAATSAHAATPSPNRVRVNDRSSSAPEAQPAAQPVERVERSSSGPYRETRAAPAEGRQPSSVRLARMAAIAALLAGLGFAVGAALGILV